MKKRVENDTCCTLQRQFAETLQYVEYIDLTLLNKRGATVFLFYYNAFHYQFYLCDEATDIGIFCSMLLGTFFKQTSIFFLQINPVLLETKPHLEIICQQYTSHCLTGNDSFLQSFRSNTSCYCIVIIFRIR